MDTGDPGERPISGEPIRRAATVVVAREGEEGPEVLLLRRGERSRFLPGYLVFPGGALDPDDEVLAARWFGTAGEAARAGAVRELIEEAGLVLTAGGLSEAADEPSALSAVDAAPPAPEQLPQIAHWIAPEDVPVRFDARFFGVAASGGLTPRPDGRETVEARWASPARVMEDWAAERELLYWPTMKTMEALAACRTVPELLALTIPQQEPVEGDELRMPRSTFFQEPSREPVTRPSRPTEAG